MSGLVTDFTELRVYQRAFALAMKVYDVSEGWPQVERYALTDQVRRSSRSVCANIAEAWFKRPYPRHFASKLTDASAEAAETLVHLAFAQAHNYLDGGTAQELEQECRRVIAGLVTMSAQPERWCDMPRLAREPEAAYNAAPMSPPPNRDT